MKLLGSAPWHLHLCAIHLPTLWCRGVCTGFTWLSCRSSEGRHKRHSTLTPLSLSAAGVPSRLEPPGLQQSDGKRPHEMILVPWRSGRHPLVWDATCTDTFAVSYRGQATTAVGCVAAHAEEKTCEKHSHLVHNYIFQPVVMETSGVIGPNSLSFLRALGSRLAQESGEANSTAYLLQRLSIAVQRGNAVAILGCASSSH